MKRREYGLLGIGGALILSAAIIRYAVPWYYHPKIVTAEEPARIEQVTLEDIQQDDLSALQIKGFYPQGEMFPSIIPKGLGRKQLQEALSLEEMLKNIASQLKGFSMEDYDPVEFTEAGDTELEGYFPGRKITIGRSSYTPQVEFSLSVHPHHQTVYLNTLRFDDNLSIHVDGSNGGLNVSEVVDTIKGLLPIGWQYERERRVLIEEGHRRISSADSEEKKDAQGEWFDAQKENILQKYEAKMREVMRKSLPSGCKVYDLSKIVCTN